MEQTLRQQAVRVLREQGIEALRVPHAQIGKACKCGTCFCCNALQVVKEATAAQDALDRFPDASPYWDSRSGQETLADQEEFGLTATNTNKERCAIHGALMRAAEDSL